MRRVRGHLFACALLAAAPAAAADTPWTPAAEAPLASAADIRETRWEAARPPGGPYDRIRVHRYRTAGPAKATVLYLPGTNMNGQVALADEDHNLWVFLARRGVEVYALDYRTAFPPSSGVSDLGFMAHWTVDTFTEDVRAAAALARKESGRPKLFVAGFSRGAFFAYACAGVRAGDDRRPRDPRRPVQEPRHRHLRPRGGDGQAEGVRRLGQRRGRTAGLGQSRQAPGRGRRQPERPRPRRQVRERGRAGLRSSL